MTDDSNRYIHFDEYKDALASLELVAKLCEEVLENELWWKWIVIGLQNALQASMVLALAGSAGLGALSNRSQRQNRQWLDNPVREHPPIRMAEYLDLLERVQKPELLEGPPIPLQGDDRRNLERLNELRRNFAHYNPSGWGIQLSYLLDIIPITLNTIEHLTTTQSRVQMQFEAQQRQRIRTSLTTIRQKLCK